LLAPKRGKDAPAPEPEAEESEKETARPLVQVPSEPAPGPANTRVSAEKPQADQRSTVHAPVDAAPRETAGERDESTPLSVEAPKATPRQQPAAKKPLKATKASDLVPGALRNVGVYLPPALLARVKNAVYQERTTYADLLIDAFEVVNHEQIVKEFTPETTMSNSGMPRRAPRKRGEAGIQIQLRLDGLQVAWLDEKVKEFDAPSRSALVSSVFKLYIKSEQAPGD
jgi:hypothetical protein